MSVVTTRLKEKIIRDGLASVKATETGAKLVGGLFGFLVAATLETKHDFEIVLERREFMERRLMDDTTETGLYWYWVHQTTTAQIQFVYDRLNVFWFYELPPEQRNVLRRPHFHLPSLMFR